MPNIFGIRDRDHKIIHTQNWADGTITWHTWCELMTELVQETVFGWFDVVKLERGDKGRGLGSNAEQWIQR